MNRQSGWNVLLNVRIFVALLMMSPGLPVLAADGESNGMSAPLTEGDYRLNPGDVLQVSVWKEDSLDREVLILPDGSITFPLVGSVVAKGKTATELQAELTRRIEPMIHDAYVTVSVKAALGNVADVLGQVNKPGEFVLSHRTTVMQALSMAGGLTPFASHGNIIVLRQKSGKEVSIPFPYDDVSEGESLDRDFPLEAGDVVVVPVAGLNPF